MGLGGIKEYFIYLCGVIISLDAGSGKVLRQYNCLVCLVCLLCHPSIDSALGN